jgi:predicted nucleic acid-binding Zn ribbon protein
MRRKQPKHVVCGDECRRAFHAAQARERRKLPMWGCSVCGKEFEPKRTDAKYCSAACKQRAHRARQGEKALG